MSERETAPPVRGVLETVLYFTDEERTERFYSGLLGFRLLAREPGRSLFYRAGASVFLLFNADRTASGGTLPPHGARGPIHTCFQVDAAEYEAWKRRVEQGGVDIVQEVGWDPGRSFYFHDPHGNLLEIADRDIWPR